MRRAINTVVAVVEASAVAAVAALLLDRQVVALVEASAVVHALAAVAG
jgi:hypothetical protein